MASAGSRRTLIGGSLAAVVVVAGAAWVVWRAWAALTVPTLRRALPRDARDVQEHAVETLPDHTYCLRARIEPAELTAYAARVGLTPHSGARVYSDDAMWLAWRGCGDTPAFWDPSDDLAGTWVAQTGRVWTFAKYERGFVYVKSISH